MMVAASSACTRMDHLPRLNTAMIEASNPAGFDGPATERSILIRCR
jgi:hypothetical protein